MKILEKMAFILTTALSAALVAAAPATLHAEELPDLDRTGSIRVSLQDGAAPVAGEELTLIEVASARVGDSEDNRGYSFVYTEPFTGLSPSLISSFGSAEESGAVSGHEADAAEIAGTILAYAQENGVAGESAETDADGVVQFDKLQTGLYLIWNSGPANGYQTIDPFLVTIPEREADQQGETSGYTYDVVANPKMEKPARFAPIVVSDPPLQKAIRGDTPSGKDRFLFTVRRLDPNSPLPANDNGHVLSINGDGMTLFADGAGRVEIGTLRFTEPGDYYYEISEENGGTAGYTYDSTVYWYKYEIRRDESGKKLTAKRLLVRSGGPEGQTDYDGDAEGTAVFTFTNTFRSQGVAPGSDDAGNEAGGETVKKPSSGNASGVSGAQSAGDKLGALKERETAPAGTVVRGARLPQTGQLWWPVMLMAAAGVAFVATGLLLGSRKRAKGKSDMQEH